MNDTMPFDKISDALAAVARGEIVVVVDDASRENEGDLIIAAEFATPEKIAFMIRHTSGVICATLPAQRLRELALPLMVSDNTESQRTAFTVSVDYTVGTTTGISAADRCATLRALASPLSRASDFARPGHVFPLRCSEGGVLRRPGHTEAASDLARLAGLSPVGVLAELVNDDGTMANPTEVERFAASHRLRRISIADLIAYRRRTEKLVEPVADARLPTRHGVFSARIYRGALDDIEHVALVYGDVRGTENVLVRVHSECLTGDIFGSTRCDCGSQLDLALERIASEGRGVVVYLRGHEGRGIGLTSKMHAYKLQDQGRDTVEANLDLGLPIDSRSYDVGAQILADLGVTTLRLMSNNPAKFRELEGYPLRIVERVPLVTRPTADNLAYLSTKQIKLGHYLDVLQSSAVPPS
jgi:3,4-dihydroxy 2-butanone 4-phosphate synthase/GTP cyclohydrolase II